MTPSRGARAGAGTAPTIRVATYNVRAFKDDRAALARVVRSMDADVLCLQEAPRHPFSGHRIAAFADQVGLTWSGGPRARMSTTLLTGLRVDVLGARHVGLPVRAGDEPRGYTVACVRLPGHQPIDVVSVHLSLRGAERGPHAEQILRALSPAERPAAVAGDLNEPAGQGAWRTFGVLLREVGGRTPTFPADDPARRIDAVFASARLPATIPPTPWDPADLARASDHVPLVADLDVSSLELASAPRGVEPVSR